MKSSTQALASMSARHPWRIIGSWIVVAALAVVAIGGLLGGSLTTEGKPTNNPESERALDARERAFPPILAPRLPTSSWCAPTDTQSTRRSSRASCDDSPAAATRASSRRRPPTSRTRARRSSHATARHDGSARHRGRRRSRVGCGGSRARRQLRGVRCLGDGREDARPRLQPPLTGGSRVRRAPVRASSGTHHPPARFRSGGGGTDPALDGDRLDHRGARLRFPACPAVRALGLRDQHAHRDGAGAIDYSLFVVSLPRGARPWSRAVRGHRLLGTDCEPRRGLQRHSVRGRHVRDAARAELDHAAWQRGRSWSGSSRSSPQRPSAGSPRVAGIASTLCGSHSSAGAYSRPPAPRAASGARSSVACSAVRGSAWCCPRPARGAGGPRLRFERGHERRHGSSRPLRLQAGFLALERDFPGTTTDPAEIVVSNASSPATEEALETLRTTLAADPRFGEGEIRRLPTAPWPSSPCRFKETLRTRTPSPR